MMLFSPFLIEILSSVDYLDAVSVLPYTITSTVLIAFSYFWKLRLDLVKKTKFIGLSHIVALIVLITTTVLLVPIYGLVGAGLAIMLHSISLLLLLAFSGNRELPLRIGSRFLGIVSLACMILVISFIGLSSFNISDWLVGGASVILYFVPLLLSRSLSMKEVKQILRLLVGK